MIENDGSIGISGLEILIVGTKGIKFFDLNLENFNPGELLDVGDQRIPYDFNSYGNIKRVLFIPKVSDESTDLCPNNGILAEKISACLQ